MSTRFKAYNDSYGHARGDLCLATIAKVLQETARRAGEVVARIGGEEFAVLMPRTDADAAVELAERVSVRAASARRVPRRRCAPPPGAGTSPAAPWRWWRGRRGRPGCGCNCRCKR